jgi:hypothetical protein
MRRILGAAVSAAFLVTACQARTAPAPAASRRPAAARATVTPAGATPQATPAPHVADALTRPAGPVRVLAGTVAVEAGYLVAAGAGNVLSHNGAAIVAAGGGNIVAAGAGNLVAAGGGNILVNNGGTMIEAGGGSILVNNGGNIVAAGAGNIVAAGGGNVVAAGGGNLASVDAAGNLVAAGAGNLAAVGGTGPAGYGLAAAADEVSGAQRAAAGLLVSVVSLRTGRYLPLGADVGGKPVYAVYSNMKGGYELYLPAAEAGNVVVVASAPGSADPRMNYNLVAGTAEADRPIELDEITALTTRYLRRAFTGRLAIMLLQPALVKEFLRYDKHLRTESRDLIFAMMDALEAVVREEGLDFAELPEGAASRLAQRFLDAALSRVDLEAIVISARDQGLWDAEPSAAEGEPLPDMKVMDALRACAWLQVEASAAKLRRDPGFFSEDYLANRVNGPVNGTPSPPLSRSWAGEIKKPSDVGEFVLVEYLGNIRPNVSAPLERLAEDSHAALDASIGDPERSEAPPTAIRLDPAIPLERRAQETVQVLEGAGYQIMIEVARRVAEDPTLVAEGRAIARDVKGP